MKKINPGEPKKKNQRKFSVSKYYFRFVTAQMRRIFVKEEAKKKFYYKPL
jgi:hypothetical protein